METTRFPVSRVEVVSRKPFDEVVAALESAVGRIDLASVTKAVTAGISWNDFERLIQTSAGSSDFIVFAEFDHGRWARPVAADLKVKLYVIGNPLIAIRMLEHDPAVGLYVPLRLCVYEDRGGLTRITYDKPSSLMAQFRSEPIADVAEVLDRKFEELATRAAG
jgi:uncharacterized protein (DUF302 family)